LLPRGAQEVGGICCGPESSKEFLFRALPIF